MQIVIGIIVGISFLLSIISFIYCGIVAKKLERIETENYVLIKAYVDRKDNEEPKWECKDYQPKED